MRKINKFLIISLLSISVFSGCKSTSPYLSKMGMYTEDGKPSWTVVTPLSNDRFYGVGSAQLSTRANSKNRAESFARTEIARQISILCNSSLIDYYNEAGIDGNGEALDVLDNFSIQVTNITLRNVIIENNYFDEASNTYWAIASFDKDNLKEAYKSEAENIKRKSEEYKIRLEKEKMEIQEKLNNSKEDDIINLLTKSLNQKDIELKKAQEEIDSLKIDKMLSSYDKVISLLNNTSN